MNIRKTLLLSLLVTVAGVCRAQGYYDDDIYFNSSKDKDKNKELAKKQKEAATKRANAYVLYPVADYPAADTYTPEGTSTRSVDEYNRRGIFAGDSVKAVDSLAAAADFAYTRKIERYYNPEIVKGSGDNELTQLYYAQPANVNIYINAPYAYGAGYWGYPYYGWGGWYDPWYYGNPWGPGYWGGYWGPAWAWSPAYWGPGYWGWGSSWGWGPGYWGPGWGWSWGWGGGISRPYNPRHPGAHRANSGIGNHRYNGRPGGNYRPAYNNGRHSSSPAYRPGSSNGNNYNGNYRPGNSNNNSNSSRDYNSYSRPGRNNNGSSFNNGGSYRGGGNSGGGATRSGGGSGRGRH